MSSDVWTFFGVMMSLVSTGLVAYAGISLIGGLRHRVNRSSAPGLNPDEVEALRAQLEENEHLRQRLGELEERVDFAERLLAQHQDPPRIGGGAS